MAKVALMNIKGEKLKDINIKDEIFAIEPNDAVMHDAIVLAHASLRQGNASTKTRTEVSGGGRKPRPQKGTGKARQGSIRAPHYVGGGVVFGPNPRDYNKKMNRKERKLALRSALSYKVKDNELMAIDVLKLETNKTKDMIIVLKNLNINKRVLFVADIIDENIVLAARNIPKVKFVDYKNLNIIDIINAGHVILEQTAIEKIEEVLS